MCIKYSLVTPKERNAESETGLKRDTDRDSSPGSDQHLRISSASPKVDCHGDNVTTITDQ